WEQRFAATTVDLMRRQRQALLARLRDEERSAARLTAKDLLEGILSLPRWMRTFRQEIRPVVQGAVGDAGPQTITDLTLGVSFGPLDPNGGRAMEGEGQRFAVQVNATAWDALGPSLAEGIPAGEGTDQLAQRVTAVMADRTAAAAEVIARTEALRAATTGSLEG